jgi:hypothetical protein
MDYKQAGVDIEAGNEVVRRIRALARGRYLGVLSDIRILRALRLDPAQLDVPSLQAPMVLAPSFA